MHRLDPCDSRRWLQTVPHMMSYTETHQLKIETSSRKYDESSLLNLVDEPFLRSDQVGCEVIRVEANCVRGRPLRNESFSPFLSASRDFQWTPTDLQQN